VCCLSDVPVCFVVCGTFFFDDVSDVGHIEICMYRFVVDIPGSISYLSILKYVDRDSAVGIATGYRLDD
jgi:hypothetical protein